MTHLIRISALAIVATTALQLTGLSIAGAQESSTDTAVKQDHARTVSQSTGTPYRNIGNQTAARTAHPITQGGTTGGTVNPGLTGDHMQHGYNGG